MLRKNWRDYEVTAEQAEEMEKAFIVFEEEDGNQKNYDLCVGIFSDLEVAKEYAEAVERTEKLYIANYNDYIGGNYDYL